MAQNLPVGDLGSIPGLGKISWRRKWQPTPIFLPGKSHGQRSLVGYSPWGRKESDTTEQLNLSELMSLQGFPGGSVGKESACSAEDPSLISGSGISPGEGNGIPLQYSCLGNPMDGRAWWATVHGVTRESDITEATK